MNTVEKFRSHCKGLPVKLHESANIAMVMTNATRHSIAFMFDEQADVVNVSYDIIPGKRAKLMMPIGRFLRMLAVDVEAMKTQVAYTTHEWQATYQKMQEDKREVLRKANRAMTQLVCA